MKKAFIVIAALVFSLVSSIYVVGPAAAVSPKPPATACFTFSDGGYVFNFLLTTKAASGNITMQTRKFKAYSVTGALSIDGSDAVPVFGSAAVYTSTTGDDIFKFNVSGTVYNSYVGVYNFSGRGNWNLTKGTGDTHAMVTTTSGSTVYSGPLTMIPCNSFDFATP